MCSLSINQFIKFKSYQYLSSCLSFERNLLKVIVNEGSRPNVREDSYEYSLYLVRYVGYEWGHP